MGSLSLRPDMLERNKKPRIGGMKNMVAADELINVTVLNVRTNTISRPSLKEDERRSRSLRAAFVCGTCPLVWRTP